MDFVVLVYSYNKKSQCHKEIILLLILLGKCNNAKFINGYRKISSNSFHWWPPGRIKGVLGDKYDEPCIAAGLPPSFLGLDNAFQLHSGHIS